MVNQVTLIGRLGNDPDSSVMPSGTNVSNFSIATNEKWTDKDGNKREKTEWHKIVVYGKSAEIVKNFARKGRLVYIEGKLRSRIWDREDNSVKIVEIVANKVTFLDNHKNNESN